MTPAMLELARKNQANLGIANVEFVQGEMEAMPLPDNSYDVIISNCVVCLSPDKDAVFAESFRVLAPGGRIHLSDVVALTPEGPAVTDARVLGLLHRRARSTTRSTWGGWKRPASGTSRLRAREYNFRDEDDERRPHQHRQLQGSSPQTGDNGRPG